MHHGTERIASFDTARRALTLAALALTACGAAPQRATVAANPASRDAATREKQLIAPWTAAVPIASEPVPEIPETTEAGRRVLETATRMVDDGTVVRGSCYDFVDAVFDEAGYGGWRHQSNVFRGRREGPYADLDLIQPGDWLWIVNHPEETPVGTHSVLFVGWEDRAAGYARVFSYVGGRADRTADLVPYDVSRTYAIRRAVEAEAPPRARPRSERARSHR